MGDNIELTSGTIYISSPDGLYSELGKAIGIDVAYSDSDDDYYHNAVSNIISSLEKYFTLECCARINRELLLTIFGIRAYILYNCPNKRVIHLAVHAKKKITRKKNFNRAIRILEESK